MKSKFFWKTNPLFFLDEEPAAGGTPTGEEPTDRVARATELWKSDIAAEDAKGKEDSDAAAAAAAAAAGGGDDAAKVAVDKKAADDKAAADKTAADAAAAAGDDAKLPYFNDKRFQEIYKERGEQKTQLDGFASIFSDKEGALGYTIDSTETLTGVLKDAYVLYDIAAGKKHPGELLDVMKANWTPEQFKSTLQGLADYAMKNGIKPDEKAANTEPWRKELDDVKSQLSAREAKENNDKLVADRMKHVDALSSKVAELCKGLGFDPTDKNDKAEIDEYALAISAEIGKNKKILEQLEKGQFGEVERLVTEYHNKLVARAQRLGDRTLAAKKAKDKLPKQPAGGAPAGKQETRTQKHDLSTSEGRIAAAKEQWDKGKTASA